MDNVVPLFFDKALYDGLFEKKVRKSGAHNIEPWLYFNHIFKELPNASTVEEIEALLPWNVVLK